MREAPCDMLALPLFTCGATFALLQAVQIIFDLNGMPSIAETAITAASLIVSIAVCVAGYLVLPRGGEANKARAARVKSATVILDFWYVVVGCFATAFVLATTIQNTQTEWNASQRLRSEISEEQERSRTNGRFFSATHLCGQMLGMDHPTCSNLAEAFVETLNVRGSVSVGPRTKALCTNQQDLPADLELGIGGILKACDAAFRSANRAVQEQERMEPPSAWIKAFDFGLKLTVCIAIGLRLAKAITDRYWLPSLEIKTVD